MKKLAKILASSLGEVAVGRVFSLVSDVKDLVILLLEGYFLYNRTIFDFVDKLLPVSNMAYSCLKKC